MSILDRDHYEGNILDETEAIEARVGALERTELSGVAGPPGPTGPQGPIGSPGPGAPAPLTQGDIIIVDAVPAITTLAVGTARQLLQTNAGGTDPEWTSDISIDTILAAGDVTLDDGAGNSPALKFVGGTNDDTIEVWLEDEAIAATSTLRIKLADAAGESAVQIYDSGDVIQIWLDSDGWVYMKGGFLCEDDCILDDGVSNSPNLRFIGGTNDDEIDIYLDDNAGVGTSILKIKLCDAGGLSDLVVVDSALANIFQLNSNGELFLVNDVRFDDGAGDSPSLVFRGGSNDDEASIRLVDDAVAGKSDIAIKLCDNSADSKFQIRDSADALKATIDSDGKSWFASHMDVEGDITCGTSGSYKHMDVWGDFTIHLSAGIEIVAGVFTPIASFSMIDSQGAVGADDLDTINDSWSSGAIITFRTVSSGRDITLKNATGNMQLNGDCILGSIYDRIMLIKTYTWWVELCRTVR